MCARNRPCTVDKVTLEPSVLSVMALATPGIPIGTLEDESVATAFVMVVVTSDVSTSAITTVAFSAASNGFSPEHSSTFFSAAVRNKESCNLVFDSSLTQCTLDTHWQDHETLCL
jgi:hypothetical protein